MLVLWLVVGFFTMAQSHSQSLTGFGVPLASQGIKTNPVEMFFVGANPQPEAVRLLEFKSRSPEASREESEMPAAIPAGLPFDWRIVYRDLYPGIDLVSYSRDGRVHYDLVVAPGSDPTQIRMIFRGLEDVELRGTFPGYQRLAGSVAPVPVEISRSADLTYRLRVGPYDRTAELIIPTTQAPLTVIVTSVASR